jgi:hypothetical protein
MRPGFRSFERAASGQVIVVDAEEGVAVPSDGFLLMLQILPILTFLLDALWIQSLRYP